MSFPSPVIATTSRLRRPAALALALALAACGGDDTTSVGDTSSDADTSDTTSVTPTLTIVAPSTNTVVAAGTSIDLVATVALPSTDLTTVTVTWTSDLSTSPLALVTPTTAGRATASVTLPAGIHTLTATAKAPTSAAASASVRVTVEAPPTAPTVTITPAAPTTLDDLEAVVSPAPSDDLTLSYRWFVDDADADIRTSKVPAARTARGATWRVAVQLTSASGLSTTTQATTTIVNSAPTCQAALLLPNAADTNASFTCRCDGRDDPDTADTAADTCEFFDGDSPIAQTTPSCTLSPDLTTRGMALTCRVTASDGELTAPPVTSSAATILNASPSAPTVTLAPVDAAILDASGELVCTVATAGVDPDGDAVTHRFAWTVNGLPATLAAPTEPTPAIVRPADLTFERNGTPSTARRGDLVRCVVRAHDGTDLSQPTTSDPHTLPNAPPHLANVQVEADPSPATANSTLTCAASTAEDADHDALTYTYRWLVDGTEVATTSTLTSGFAKGDIIRCEMTATDGLTTTDPIPSKNAVLVVNTPPSLASAALTPTTGRRHDVFTCAPVGYADADLDPATYRFAWKATNNSTTIPLVSTSATFTPTTLPPGATLSCVVTPYDGEAEGTPVESAAATIENTAPTLGSASITPANPTVTSTLECVPADFVDPDGDAPTYTYTWTRNAQSLPNTGATLANTFVEGDQLRCQVTPSDGFVSGAPVLSPTITIGNSPPNVASVTLSPLAGSLCATYTCTSPTPTDADAGDTVSLTWRWEKNGTTASQTTPTWSTTLAPGDTLRCFATPTDGDTAGTERASALATADNAPPSLTSVAITPAAPGVGAVLTCTPSGYSDDCSSATYTYRWFVNGASGATTSFFNTTGLPEDTQLRCEVTPRDASTAGPAVSSATLTLGPGDAIAPTVAVNIAGSTATCTTVTPEQWFANPTYTYHWSVNGAPESVGALTHPAAPCDLLSCRLVVSDARSTLSSPPAYSQAALGDGCDDGNDCTAAACSPSGGCAAPLPTSGGLCRHADPCLPTGTCAAGDCIAEGNVCTEEPLASTTLQYPIVTARGASGYSVYWGTQDLRMTDGEDSRMNELVDVDLINRNQFPLDTMKTRPTALPNGDVFMLTASNCSTGPGFNPYNSCTFYGTTVDKSGTVTALPATSGISSDRGCGGLQPTATRALDLAGIKASVLWTSSRYYGGNTCRSNNHNIRLLIFEGEAAGTEPTLVTIPPGNLDTWLVPIIELDATTTPPGSESFVLTWVDSNGTTLHAQRFSWSGGQLTAGTQSTVTSGGTAITNPMVTSFLDGTFLVGWSHGTDAWLRYFDESGTPVGASFRVNDLTTGTQSLTGLSAFSDFGFVAVWYDSNSDGGGLRAQLFDASTTPDGPAFGLNAFTAGVQSNGSVAALGNDDWVVAWHDATLGRLVTRRFERDGAPSAGIRDELVPERTSSDQSAPRGATNGNGQTLVVWETLDLYVGQSAEIAARLVGPDGVPVGPELQVNTVTTGIQRRPVVAGGNNRFIVAWESLGEDGNSYGIIARILDGSGNPLGAPFVVNTTTAGLQQHPSVAMRPDGTMLIAWDSGTADFDVMAKAYDKDGNVRMNETTLNTTTAGRQDYPTVSVHPTTGEFFVAWQSQNQVAAGSGYDIFGRKVTLGAQPTTPTLGTESRFNAASDGDQKFPAAVVSGADALAVCWETPDAGASTDVLCGTYRWNNLQIWTAEAQLATLTTGAQQKVQLAVGPQQQLLAAFESDNIDLDGKAVLVRNLGISGPPTGTRIVANRMTTSHQQAPFIVSSGTFATGRFLVGWQSDAQDGAGQGVYLRMLTAP